MVSKRLARLSGFTAVKSLALLMAMMMGSASMAQESAQHPELIGAGPTSSEAENIDPKGAGDEVFIRRSLCASESFAIGQLPWPSAQILAQIHSKVLTSAYACDVRLVPAEQTALLSSLATTQQPAVIPEIWTQRDADIWNGAVKGNVLRAATSTYDTNVFEGWYIPRALATKTPSLTTIEGLKENSALFKRAGDAKARFYSCPQEWACGLLNEKMLHAFKLDNDFEDYTPLDRFTLDRMLLDAAAAEQPFVTYYWQPNALIARLDLVPVATGAFDMGSMLCMGLADCLPFAPSSFPADTVVIGLAEWVFTDAPLVAQYFQRATMPIETMNILLAWQAENEATAGEAADHFIGAYAGLVDQWLGR